MSTIKIIRVISESEPTREDNRKSLSTHKRPCTRRCMALTEAGTRHLFLVDGVWMDENRTPYT